MIEIVSKLHETVPPFISRALSSPAMQRLKDVGMNCGCEYTSFPCFTVLPPYSRYEHSLGVSSIVWHFSHDEKQALSALFHDIATPVFAHVIDFMRGDYLTQEATEDGTKEFIERDPVITALLSELGLSVGDVSDYHLYPVADNKSPRLCADRLEYTLENMVHYRHASVEEALEMYSDLTVEKNEEGVPELVFRTEEPARRFSHNALSCGMFYTTDQDRYSMQRLSEICLDAVRRNVITEADLYTDETGVIQKFSTDPETWAKWTDFRKMCQIRAAKEPEGPGPWRKINAKKRYIDPYVLNKGRVSLLDPSFAEKKRLFEALSFDYYVIGGH